MTDGRCLGHVEVIFNLGMLGLIFFYCSARTSCTRMMGRCLRVEEK